MQRQARNFGMALAVVSGVLAIWPVFNGNKPTLSWFVAAILLLATALVTPRLLDPPLKIWFKIGHIIGIVNTKLILVLVYGLIIMPIAFLLKLSRYDSMGIRSFNSASSWKYRHSGWTHESYKKQF